ncbi:hypothetical protein Ancab_008786 [Ancistrocladus abbreviatus]
MSGGQVLREIVVVQVGARMRVKVEESKGKGSGGRGLGNEWGRVLRRLWWCKKAGVELGVRVEVKEHLSDVSRLPIWSSVEEQSAFTFPKFPRISPTLMQPEPVTTFLLYLNSWSPLTRPYLVMRQMQMKPSILLLKGCSKVAEGATTIYMEQLRALPMAIPPLLSTFQTCVSTPRDQLRDPIRSA